jgi:hypothetical protein
VSINALKALDVCNEGGFCLFGGIGGGVGDDGESDGIKNEMKFLLMICEGSVIFISLKEND